MNSSLIQHKLFLFRLKEQFHSQPNKCIIFFLWCHSYKRQDCIEVADFGFMWYCILMWHGSKPVFYYIFSKQETGRMNCKWIQQNQMFLKFNSQVICSQVIHVCLFICNSCVPVFDITWFTNDLAYELKSIWYTGHYKTFYRCKAIFARTFVLKS